MCLSLRQASKYVWKEQDDGENATTKINFPTLIKFVRIYSLETK